MSEGYEGRGAERGYLQTVGKQRSRKEEGRRRGGRCISPENMSYLRDEGAGTGGTEGGETGVLLATAKLSPTTHGHFSGTFLQVRVQKELAGGVVNLFPM